MARGQNKNFVNDVEEMLDIEVSERETQEHAKKKAELRENRRKRELQKRRKKLKIVFLGLFVLLLAAVAGGFFLYQDNLAYSVCRVEAGGIVTPSDFLKTPDDTAVFAESSQPIDTLVPGEYSVKIKTGIFTTSSTLIVEDKIAPELEVCDLVMTYGETCDIEAFVTKLEDITATSLSYTRSPDFAKSGKQMVSITATDLGGNAVTKEAELWLTPVIPVVRMELGNDLPDASELVAKGVDAEYVSDDVDCFTVGEYTAVICADEIEYEVQFIVEDTTGPTLVVKEFMDYAVIEKTPEDFVRSVEDLSEVASVEFLEAPDFNYIGTQAITIVATDIHGNKTQKVAPLIQVADEDAPIFLTGEDFLVYIGETVAYKSKVTYTDNCEIGLNLTVDASAVDLKTEGKYPVVYTATDAAGNVSTKTLTVTVKEYRADEVELLEKIDAIFAKIFTDGMTNREKCKAIYDYIRGHVSYVSHSEKGDEVKAAMEGLTKGKGDCYVYFSLSKIMLTHAGFPNMDIERIRVGDSMHFWNLVDIGDGHGWYHFDTTPRVGGPYIFLWDDETLWEYSDSHKGSHNYDKSLYPEIN